MHARGRSAPEQATVVSGTFKSLKQEEADPGPARVALAAPAHAVLSHGRVGGAAAGLGVAAHAAHVLVARRAAPRARARPARRQPREVQLVLHTQRMLEPTPSPHPLRDSDSISARFQNLENVLLH